MKISVCIPHMPVNESFDKMLADCIASLKGQYDELIIFRNDGIGYGKSFNEAFKLARGEYIFGISNDTKLISGNLQDMCNPEFVTYSQDAQWGCFFCLPRFVLDKVGGFDPRYGLAYFEDDDYLLRLELAKVPFVRIQGVQVAHVGGATVRALNKEEEQMQKNRSIFMERREQLLNGADYYVPLS